MILTNEDGYALARAIQGLPPHPEVVVSPIVAMFTKQWVDKLPSQDEVEKLRQLFGDDLIAQILRVDPRGPAPVQFEAVDVPPLPSGALLNDEQIAAGNRVGGWLTQWMKFATAKAAMTDDLFLEGGGLWLIGTACARRVCLNMEWGREYNNFFVWWVAPTTYYKKSTGLGVVRDIAFNQMSHLLMANQSSPEMMLYKLAGQRTTNFDDLSAEEQNREESGRRFAAQRGVIADEISSWFVKDYMKGLPELLMQMADAPDLLEHEYKGFGKLIVKNAGLSLLGATTPSRLQAVADGGWWEDGMLARIALLTPSQPEVVRPYAHQMSEKHLPPRILTDGLRYLMDNLPQPKTDAVFDDPKSHPSVGSIAATISNAALDGWNAYADALHNYCAPTSGLDFRLTGVYGRLPVQGLRVAMSLAAIDWAMRGAEGGIVISEAHWWRAQTIVERWRESAHRLLCQVTKTKDRFVEDQVMRVLNQHHPKPPNQYEIWRRVNAGDRKSVYSAIDALANAGVIAKLGDVGYMAVNGRSV